MPFCSKCGAEVLSTAQFCSSCGNTVAQTTTTPPMAHTETPPQSQPSIPQTATQIQPTEKNLVVTKTYSLDQKLHIFLISIASIAVLLLYTTFNFALIGIATGICFGLSLRLFFSHKKNDFKGTNKLDWILLAAFSTAALVLMLAGVYNIQAFILIFVAVRSFMIYLKMNSGAEKLN